MKLASICIILIFDVMVALSVANMVQAVGVTATVTVGSLPGGVAYDPGKNEIFVVDSGDNTISVISDSNNSVVGTIPIGDDPGGVAYDSAMGEIFVTNTGDNTVSVISDSNNTVVATIPVGEMPSCAGAITYDSLREEMFVIQFNAQVATIPSSVSIISDRNNTVVATIPVGKDSDGLSL